MTRTEWKALSRKLRSSRGDSVRAEMVNHGGTYWTVTYVPRGSDRGIHCKPSIIRDRAPSARVAVELDWTRYYRLESVKHRRNGQYWRHLVTPAIMAALASIGDCRAIRTARSAFQAF